MVPYKVPPEDQQEEYAMRLGVNIHNQLSLDNLKRDIKRVFEADNKGMNVRAEMMLANTLAFVNSLKTF